MKQKKLPIIFLAFANDKEVDKKYLRNITQERNSIRQSLSKIDNELCLVTVEPDASIERVLDVFQKYQDQIVVFHYGGHANSYELLLESEDGKNVHAYRKGIVSFLSNQKGLKLIFLNGCSTHEHAMSLTKAGIPIVVGTSRSK